MNQVSYIVALMLLINTENIVDQVTHTNWFELEKENEFIIKWMCLELY